MSVNLAFRCRPISLTNPCLSLPRFSTGGGRSKEASISKLEYESAKRSAAMVHSNLCDLARHVVIGLEKINSVSRATSPASAASTANPTVPVASVAKSDAEGEKTSDSKRGSEITNTRDIAIDSGYESESLSVAAEMLDICLSRVDLLEMSHDTHRAFIAHRTPSTPFALDMINISVEYFPHPSHATTFTLLMDVLKRVCVPLQVRHTPVACYTLVLLSLISSM